MTTVPSSRRSKPSSRSSRKRASPKPVENVVSIVPSPLFATKRPDGKPSIENDYKKGFEVKSILPAEQIPGCVGTAVWVTLIPAWAPSDNRCYIGIDPGQINMGAAFLHNETARICQIRLTTALDAVERVLWVLGFMDYFFSFIPDVPAEQCRAVIEGASQSELYGQVALAEARTAAIIGLLRRNICPIVLPPGTVKKVVFGNGHAKASEFWPHLVMIGDDKKPHDDAAAALSQALFMRIKTDIEDSEGAADQGG
jgi:Holliday junction resolvasome RuvABC endonuclease subunit